jgi:lipopolysaccharide/colanic/teichoic acid biosynthesis glycosyltransferase
MNSRKLEIWILLADLAWIGIAFLISDVLRFGLTWVPGERASIHALVPFVFSTIACWTVLSAFVPMDGFRGGWKLSVVFSQVLLGTAFTAAALLAIGYLTRSYVSRLALGYFMVLLAPGFLMVRCSARQFLRWRHEEGELWRLLILGSGRVAQEVAAKIEQHPEMLCRVVGMLFPNQDTEELIVPGLAPTSASQLSTLDIFELIRSEHVNEVIIALSQAPSPEIRTLLGRIRDMGVETTLVPQSYELYASRPNLIALDGLPLVQLREPGLSRRYLVLKRVMDLLVSLALLAPAFLFLLPFAVILSIKKGSAFRRELRGGRYGVSFPMLRLNVDRPTPSDSKLEHFLERFSITELPQLWNVLRGQMSLVGPRPDPTARLTAYSEWQLRRLKVKPGMTGLAQVHGMRESSSFEQKTRFDLEYVVNPYLLWDILLLLETVWTLLRRQTVARTPAGMREHDSENARFRVDVMSNAHRTQPSAD